MVKLKVQPNELPEEIYVQNKVTITKLIGGAVAVFFIAFFLNFPISTIIKSKITAAISSNRACPISYDDISLEWFMPKVIIKKPVISGVCFNNPSSALKLKNLKVALNSPSFSPVGLRFHTKIKHKQTVLNVYPTLGVTRQAVRIEKSSISHETLRLLLGRKSIKFSGDFEIEALVKTNKGNLTEADVLISSTNLNLPPQNVGGLVDLPPMPIGQFQLKAKANAKNLLELNDVRLGDANSPIIASVEGNIKLNAHNMSNSNLDLLGEVKFSQTVLENFGILNAMLSSKTPSEKGFYKFKVSGRMASPIPSFQ
jgi:hypothetical protein